MTRYAIDVLTALRIAREGSTVSQAHQLVAPAVLRSQALAIVYREVRAGETTRAESRRILDGVTTMRIRLLGDRTSRGSAFSLAEKLDWPEIGDAEYVSVALLQADAFVTLDERLAARVKDVVTLAPYKALFTPG